MERQPVRSGGRATFQRAPNGPNGETRGARVHSATTDEEFFGPTPNDSRASIPVIPTDEHAAAPTDSAGSDEGSDRGGNAARMARRPKTTAEKLEAVKLKALEEAKKGIVNVPRGSVTKAKHGLAISLEEDEERKQAEYDRKMLDAQVAAALTPPAPALPAGQALQELASVLSVVPSPPAEKPWPAGQVTSSTGSHAVSSFASLKVTPATQATHAASVVVVPATLPWITNKFC